MSGYFWNTEHYNPEAALLYKDHVQQNNALQLGVILYTSITTSYFHNIRFKCYLSIYNLVSKVTFSHVENVSS
jgi:hypothetical protein